MRLKTAMRACRAAANAALTAAIMSFAADLSVCYTLLFVADRNRQMPLEDELMWLVPILALMLLTLRLSKASEELYIIAQALDIKARIHASVRRATDTTAE